MKILVADDDAVSRSMMRRLLSQCGYAVSTAGNGLDAVEILSLGDGPRLLLLDWMMPGLDGPEVCRAIRAGSRRAYVYIILLTSKDSKGDLIAGLEAGADDYLTKPCNVEELRARLRTGERILQLEDSLVAARDEMRYRATHDGLTELLNRTAIIQRLDRTRRSETQFAVVICDVDHFKRINDTHGHPVGDEVLREVARRLRGSVRKVDAVGRFGGEEFLVVLEGCDAATATQITQAICQDIRSVAVTTSAGPVHVSISAGALHGDRMAPDAGVDELLQAVDTALYQAKTGGRDRFVVVSLDRGLLAVA